MTTENTSTNTEIYEARFHNGRILWRGTRAECEEAAKGTSAKVYKAKADLTYYGFSSANNAEQPAWFHTEAAARRFAEACGFENIEIETTTDAEACDIMDTPEKAWTRE
jgi:hypothetical protein